MTTRMQQGRGPSTCWHCNKQLQRVPGKVGHYFFLRVEDRRAGGAPHRVHGHCWSDQMSRDPQYKLAPPDA